jgi:hypothetical protein
LPNQTPTTPSYRQSLSVVASWLPITDVAASSSFTPGWNTIGRSGTARAARATSSPNDASGDPWYPDTNAAVVRPALRSMRSWSPGMRATACTPDR